MLNVPVGIIVFAMAVFIYLLPTYIAIRRKHSRTAVIYIINLFFGWTIIGWVLVFLMACFKAK
jgi:uncharacterized membrane protein